MSYMCQKCKKTRAQLVEEGKLNLVQGYEQCADCHGDLEHSSVVKISEQMERAKKKALKNNDYIVREMDADVVKFGKSRGVDMPKEHKVLNWFEYMPESYKKRRIKQQEKLNQMFRDMHNDYDDYNQIID